MENVWSELIELRKKNGLTTEELAKMCGIPFDELLKLEKGIEEVDERQLDAISVALNVSPVSLLGIEPIAPNNQIEARFRAIGRNDITIEPALKFGVEFLEKINELKYLNSID